MMERFCQDLAEDDELQKILDWEALADLGRHKTQIFFIFMQFLVKMVK